MGTQVVCDGCGVDTQFLDKFVLQAAFLEVGVIQADLCPTCAAPFWATKLGKKLIEDAKKAREEEQLRRATVIEAQAIAAAAVAQPPRAVEE